MVTVLQSAEKDEFMVGDLGNRLGLAKPRCLEKLGWYLSLVTDWL